MPVSASVSPPISTIPSHWQEWIALNLMQQVATADLVTILQQNGFDNSDIRHAIQTAEAHPYIMAGKQLAHTLHKRNWLLSACDSLARLDESYHAKIDVIDTPSFDYFIQHYYSTHRPVVLKNGIRHWQALQQWTPDYIAQKLGNAEVEIQFNRSQDPQFERNSTHLKKVMPIQDFVELLNTNQHSNDYYMTANNTASSWHSLRLLFEEIGDFGEGYRQPNNDGTFFWMGPKGTFTPLHHDLTNNMLVQIYGSKKVTLIPAWQVPSLYNDTHVFSQTDFPNIDFEKFPLLKNITPIEVQLDAGDAIFTPIAWWHCVESLSTSISISFTNFNVANDQGVDFPRN